MKKATADNNSGVVIHPWASRRYPAKQLNDLDFADDTALLESTALCAQEQINSTTAAAKDLGFIVNISKTEYMTVNCNPHPTLQVYGEPIAHLADFK